MKKLQLLFILTVFVSLNVSAQMDDTLRNYSSARDRNRDRDYDDLDKGFSWDRVFTGGSFGLSIGDITDIQLDPEFGYRFAKYFYAGVGVDYEYYYTDALVNSYYTGVNASYTEQFIGGNIFARYVVYKKFFIEAQFKEINWDAPEPDFVTGNYVTENVTVPAFNVGAGYMEPVGRKSAFYIVALYDLLYGDNSPSASPFAIQVGFNFGL